MKEVGQRCGGHSRKKGVTGEKEKKKDDRERERENGGREERKRQEFFLMWALTHSLRVAWPAPPGLW